MGAALAVRNFGTDTSHDLFLIIIHFPANTPDFANFMAVCRSINRHAGVAEVPGNFENLPTFYAAAAGTHFQGVYKDNSGTIAMGSSLAGYPAFCAYQSASWPFILIPLILR